MLGSRWSRDTGQREQRRDGREQPQVHVTALASSAVAGVSVGLVIRMSEAGLGTTAVAVAVPGSRSTWENGVHTALALWRTGAVVALASGCSHAVWAGSGEEGWGLVGFCLALVFWGWP